jgi:hypothetical protein
LFVAVALLAVPGAWVQAQPPAGPAPQKIYTKRTAFKLPLRIDAKERAQLNSVQLYVKSSPGGVWQFKDAGPPAQADFTFRAPQDGEYWFSVVTVDKNSKPNPADLNQEPPGVIVVVDTKPPEVDLRPFAGAPGETLLQCTVRDTNLDPAKVVVEGLLGDQTWQALEPVPDQPGVYHIGSGGTQPSLVRATAADRAGNTASCQLNLLAALPAPAAAAANAPAPTGYHAEKNDGRTDKPEGRPERAVVGPDKAEGPADKVEVPAESPTEVPPKVNATFEKVGPPVDKPAAPVENHAPPAAAAPGLPGLQLINSNHVSLDYQIDQKKLGASDHVEVWLTCDDGQTWQRLCEDADKTSPVAFDLPGEGLYGVSVVVNGGSGSVPPPKGDPPATMIEVDVTKPVAQLMAVRPVPGEGAGHYLITWSASDKNLKPQPIDLYYATRHEGPWQPIAKSLKNDGTYRWDLPKNQGTEFFVKMEVSDRAGNMTRCEALQPIISDGNRPRAKVVGVSVAPAKLFPPAAN